jgi:hypothetical protein
VFIILAKEWPISKTCPQRAEQQHSTTGPVGYRYRGWYWSVPCAGARATALAHPSAVQPPQPAAAQCQSSRHDSSRSALSRWHRSASLPVCECSARRIRLPARGVHLLLRGRQTSGRSVRTDLHTHHSNAAQRSAAQRRTSRCVGNGAAEGDECGPLTMAVLLDGERAVALQRQSTALGFALDQLRSRLHTERHFAEGRQSVIFAAAAVRSVGTFRAFGNADGIEFGHHQSAAVHPLRVCSVNVLSCAQQWHAQRKQQDHWTAQNARGREARAGAEGVRKSWSRMGRPHRSQPFASFSEWPFCRRSRRLRLQTGRAGSRTDRQRAAQRQYRSIDPFC